MAFALTGYRLMAVQTDKAVSPRFLQFVELDITATAADVALDLNNPAGTFWTAALANGTYGATATAALASLNNVVIGARALLWDSATFILNRARAASDAVGVYTKTYSATEKVPAYALHAGEGQTADTIVLCYEMKQGWQAETL